MPLYYSNPRQVVGRADQRSLRRSEYTKLAPSKFKYTLRSPMHHLVRNGFKAQLPAFAAIQSAMDVHNDRIAVSVPTLETFMLNLRLPQLFPFNIPSIMVTFKTTPQERVVQTIQNLGGSISGFGKRANQTYLIERSNTAVLNAIFSNPSWDLDSNVDAPKGFINADRADLFVHFNQRLFAVTYALQRFGDTRSQNLIISAATFTDNEEDQERRVVTNTTIDGSVKRDTTIMASSAPFVSYANTTGEAYVLSVITPTPKSMKIWSSLVSPPTAYARGIFARYEKDYTTPDRDIFSTFFNTFPGFFKQSEFVRLGRFWEEEMSETTTGMEMAHLMLSCIIAFKGDKGLVPLFNESTGRYHGCVLTGNQPVVTPAGAVDAKTEAEVTAEINEIKTHLKVLTDVLGVFNKTDAPSSITSMRMLRRVCGVADDNLPSTDAMTRAKELLPYLDFGRYLDINTGSFSSVLPLMADPSLPIPDTLPMHPGYFFTTSRIEGILSAFGATAPTLQTASAGAETRVSNIVSRSGEIRAPNTYSTIPPTILQISRVDTMAAASYWTHILANGTAAMNTTTSAGQSARKFTGTEKADFWRLLNEWVGVGVTHRGTSAPVAAPIPVGTDGRVTRRRREEDSDDEDDSSRRVRTRLDLL